ncbi:MAG TPA: hypothetical protein VMJ10_13150 [Kofleriaceae bacterium]|nr:hypothetical protein [Kofleriaceae bacterium]
MRAVAVAALLAIAPAARADSFEAKAQGATRVKHVEDVVWALVAACDRGDDTERRQCRVVRDARAAELAGKTLVLDGDASAFAVRAWDAARKSSRVTLSGCIRCGGVDVDGRSWPVIAAGAAPHVEAGQLAPGYLYDSSRQFADDTQAERWAKSVAAARVELVVKVPAKPRWSAEGKDGVALDVVAYRVVVPCDGSVIAANPPSDPVAADPKQCPRAAEVPGNEPAVETLTSDMIEDAMRPVYAAARTCATDHKLAGKARLHVTVGADGTVIKLEQQGDFATTPAAPCIDKAVKAARFPHTTQRETSFNYPMTLP